jgi:predicted SAM-dependent methyltransferase
MVNVLEAMAAYISALQEHNKSQSVLTNALTRQMEQFAYMQTDFQQLQIDFQQLQTDYQSLKGQNEQLATVQNNDRQWLENVSKEARGLSPWIEIIARKVEMLSLNVRETMAFKSPKLAEWPEPRIVDPEKYAQRLSEMKGEVKINLGCGEKPLPDYLNIDARSLPDVDIIADVHRLPFDPGTVFEISSAHLIEHFREHHSRMVLVPYWKSLLSAEGRLRVICPNWASMLEQLGSGHMSLEFFKKLTFGAQDYEGDDHFTMYTPETLEKLLLEAGFRTVQRIVLDRDNGGCPEMELLAS